jgi:predicted nucleic acid-binding protein
VIVVDTNLIGYLFLTSDRSDLAELALRKDPEWAAPLLWRGELRNVLAQYVRRSLLGLEDAQRIMSAATETMNERGYEVASDPVLKLAAERGCSAYDCEFVALAQDLGVALVTTDRQVLRAFPEIAVGLDTFCAQR